MTEAEQEVVKEAIDFYLSHTPASIETTQKLVKVVKDMNNSRRGHKALPILE